MSDTEQIDLSDVEAPVVVASDEDDETIQLPPSDDSVRSKKKKKKKKKKKERAKSSERRSRSSSTESGNERSTETSSRKKKKKKKPEVPILSPNTSLSSGNNSSEGSKRNKKMISQIDMTGGVTEIDPQMKKKPKGHNQLPRNASESGTEQDESSVKQKNANESNGKKKKNSRTASPTEPKTGSTRVHEIEEIEMPSKKRKKKKKKKKIPDNRTIEYGRVFGYNQNALEGQKQKRRGKRPSERTETTFDYDEEDQRMRLSCSTMGSFGESSFGDERHERPVRRGRRREYDGEYTDDDDNDEDEDEDEDEDIYTDDEDDIYMREMGYNDPTDGSLYDDYFYEMHGMEDERPSFKRATFDLADTGIRDTKCCLIFAGIFFICSTVGVSILIGKLTKRDEW